MRTSLPLSGQFVAAFLPYFSKRRIRFGMTHWFPLFSAVLFSFSFAASALRADPTGFGMAEFPTEHAALVEATESFFDAVELETPKREQAPVLGWAINATRSYAVEDDVAVLTKMGPVKHLTGYQVTWYPTERLLGTVDFMGTWGGNRNLVCGYVTWDLTVPYEPRLHSISANFISPDALNQSDAREVHRALIGSNCAYGAIEANYAFFTMDANG